MNIGIDIDEVSANFLEALSKHYHKKRGKLHNLEEFKEYNWGIVWGIPREEAISFTNDFLETHSLEEITPVEHAKESFNKILKNYNILFITSRPERFKLKTEQWIKHHFGDIKFELIHAAGFSITKKAIKAEICREKNIPLMIEDAPETALECANFGIKVILFNKPWNQKVEHKNIKRVNGWLEAMKEIEPFKNT